MTDPQVIPEADFKAAVAAAIQAPSLHNTQPWRFRLDTDRNEIEVRADESRALAVADPNGWAMRVACGAAAFNLRLAAAVQGRPLNVTWQPSNADRTLLAVLTAAYPRPATPTERRLYRAIPHRHSNRDPFLPQPVPPTARTDLIEAARAESAWLELVTGTVPVAAVAEITHAANRVLNRNPAYVAELQSWTRHDGRSVDGVPVAAAGLEAEPSDLFPQRPFGERGRAAGSDYEPEPLVAVLGTAGNLPVDHLHAGHALQRLLLTVTDLGLASSMFSQPIEVPSAREQLRLALGRYGTPQMVLRVGYGAPGIASPRRRAEDVIDGVRPATSAGRSAP